MNQLNQIAPYRTAWGWSFDDDRVGLKGEPFVLGIPEIINHYIHGNQCIITFSADPFPNHNAIWIWCREEYGGNWYKDSRSGLEGWLCPALFRYFESAPKEIYLKLEEVS